MKFGYIIAAFSLVAVLVACGKDEASGPSEFKGEISDERAVDMGTGLAWSGINLGAGKAEQSGGFYSWAEPAKDTTAFSMDTYVHYSPTLTIYLKYASGDKILTIQSDDDPATQIWGPEYRTPTRNEFQNLIDACDWTYAKVRGTVGWVATSKTTSKSIFFPLCGYRAGETLKFNGSAGVYWTSELSSPDSEASGTNVANVNISWSLGLSASSAQMGFAERYLGASVRPVSSL